MRIFCFGLGLCARSLALLSAQRADFQVAGLSRDAEKIAALNAQIERRARERTSAGAGDRNLPRNPPLFNDIAEARALLRQSDAVMISAPPDRRNNDPLDPILTLYGEEILQARPKKIIYLSSASVYGDKNGKRIDETAPPAPRFPRAIARLRAENQWRDFARAAKSDLAIFRLAGIYGPKRNALREVLKGTARRIWKKEAIFNRISSIDVARAAAAFAISARGGENIWNLSDDFPERACEVTAFAARLLGKTPPPLIALEYADMSPMAKSFYEESRVLDSRKIQKDLNILWRHPNYKIGLLDMLRDEKAAAIIREKQALSSDATASKDIA